LGIAVTEYLPLPGPPLPWGATVVFQKSEAVSTNTSCLFMRSSGTPSASPTCFGDSG
jgi:hypothetical protein